MDNRKQAIVDALRAFIEQRPGFDWHDYATARDYRSDQRRATRQLHDARQLLRAIELRDSITADDILREAQSGRVTIRDASVYLATDTSAPALAPGAVYSYRVDYCTGQYWCTEFRAGVCRLLSSVLWTWMREKGMPEPTFGVSCLDDFGGYIPATSKRFNTLAAAERYAAAIADSRRAMVDHYYNGKRAGDWLRASFRREFGRPLAGRWFS